MGASLLAPDTLISIKENLDREIIPSNTWNADLCTRSFAEIKRIETSGAQIIGGHDSVQSGQLRKGRNAYG